MHYKTIPTSQGRSNLAEIVRRVDERGDVYVFTVHGEEKAALIDVDLFNEFVENVEFGITEGELVKRSKEKRVSLSALKRTFNVSD